MRKLRQRKFKWAAQWQTQFVTARARIWTQGLQLRTWRVLSPRLHSSLKRATNRWNQIFSPGLTVYTVFYHPQPPSTSSLLPWGLEVGKEQLVGVFSLLEKKKHFFLSLPTKPSEIWGGPRKSFIDLERIYKKCGLKSCSPGGFLKHVDPVYLPSYLWVEPGENP